MRLLVKILLLLATFTALAPAQTTVSGNLRDATGAAFQSDAYLHFRLRGYTGNVPRINGSSVIIAPEVDIYPDSSGNITTTIYGNNLIVPTGTYWTIEFHSGGRTQFSVNCTLSSTPFSINNLTGCTTAPPPEPLNPNSVVQSYVHNQSPAATTWTINHNFGDANAICTFFDSASPNQQLFPDTVLLTNGNTTTATFTVAQAGRAICIKAANFSLLSGTSSVVITNPVANQAITGGYDLTLAGRFGLNNTPQHANYLLDIGTNNVTNVRIGPANTDGGGYITSTVANNMTLTSGSAFNGSQWVAKAADIAQIHIGNNQIEFHTDSGLTPGNTFSPTIRMHISGSQVLFRGGSAAVPSISNFEQSPNPVDGFWFPTNQVGVTIGGTGRASFSSTALAPITNVGYSLGTSSLSYLNGYFRNVLARNAADTADVVLVQKNPSDDDVFVGNGNARDLYLVAGSGRKVYLSNTLESTASGQFTKLNTASNCSSSASPATCSSASAGSVVVAAAATTVVVNTTAVTANSQIILTRDNSLGTKLSVTCNTQSSLTLGTPYVSARSAGTSFTITLDVAPTTNPMCISYQVLN